MDVTTNVFSEGPYTDGEKCQVGAGFDAVEWKFCNPIINKEKAEATTVVGADKDGSSGPREEFFSFDSYQDYEKGVCTRLGVAEDDYIKGFCGSSIARDGCPFRTSVEKVDESSYNFYQWSMPARSTQLDAKPFGWGQGDGTVKSDGEKSGLVPGGAELLSSAEGVKEALQAVCAAPKFSRSTKPLFDGLFHRFGTHVVTQVTHGYVAELQWRCPLSSTPGSPSQSAPAFDSSTFKEHAEKWKNDGFGLPDPPRDSTATPEPSTDSTPSPDTASDSTTAISDAASTPATRASDTSTGTSVQRYFVCIPNRTSESNEQDEDVSDVSSVQAAQIIGFKVRPISDLFTGRARVNVEFALKIYTEERRPKHIDDLEEGMLAVIRHAETGKLVRVDEYGHLFADVDYKFGVSNAWPLECQMMLRKKDKSVALKSTKYNRLISRGNTKPRFRFYYLPINIIGPHESFTCSGDFLKVHGLMHGPRYLYVGKADQVFPDGDITKRSRFNFYIIDKFEPVEPHQTLVSTTSLDMLHAASSAPPAIKEASAAEVEKAFPSLPPGDRDAMKASTDQIAAKGKPTDEKNASKYPTSKIKTRRPHPRAHMRDVPDGGKWKFNSTSSLYINDTMSAPDMAELLNRLATSLRKHVVAGHEMKNPKLIDIFDERKFPVFKRGVSDVEFVVPPSVQTMSRFLRSIFSTMKLGPECAIMTLAYVERTLAQTPNLVMHPTNWRRMILGCIMMASKVWEDLAVWNVDFLDAFPSINVRDLNRMEKQLLACLKFNVTLNGSQYAKYYFELRDLSDPSKYPLQPLNLQAAQRLEQRSRTQESAVKTRERQKVSRSMSLHDMARGLTSPRMVLN